MSWGPAAATSLRRGVSSLKEQEESGLGSCSAPHLPLRGKLYGAARALNPLNCTKQQHPARRKQEGNTRPHPKAQPLEGFKPPTPSSPTGGGSGPLCATMVTAGLFILSLGGSILLPALAPAGNENWGAREDPQAGR